MRQMSNRAKHISSCHHSDQAALVHDWNSVDLMDAHEPRHFLESFIVPDRHRRSRHDALCAASPTGQLGDAV
jgi:hypothetical protein